MLRVLVLLLLALALRSTSVAAVPMPAGWTLVWHDEFDCTAFPDPRNWTHEIGFVRNHEPQWYQPDNARCRDGLLVIEARRERKRNLMYDAGSPNWRNARAYARYTSSSLTTRGLHAWLYGRFEMRARIDTRAGLWPVLWTVNAARPWSKRGEVDIMEAYGGNLLANVAWGDVEPEAVVWDIARYPLAGLGQGWSRRFHVWRMDWDRQFVRIYLDGRLLNQTALKDTHNRDGSGNPLRQAHSIMLSLAIRQADRPETTRFPARMEVDYVRVYQRSGSAGR